ncbi:MAG: DUF4974 domain-containing protein [Gemmatimonadales bacterium]|nr:MAG: DUF4974 domain-containing protein [Gemmatimonadales bacterium]
MDESDAVDELIVLYLQGRTTRAQEEEIRSWRSASPENESRYQAFVEVWQRTAVAQPREVSFARPTLSDLEGRVRRRREAVRSLAPGMARTLRWAAVVILALGIGALASTLFTDPDSAAYAFVTEVGTGDGEMATWTLPDGTVVRLAPNTRLQVRQDANLREVELDGRAFLSVRPDPTRPFRIITPEGEARVIGTRFEVNTTSGELDLLVVQGAVAVSGGGREVEVRAGERSRSQAEREPQIETVRDVEARIAWLGTFLAFESTPLSQVAAELESRLGRPIEVTDPDLRARTLTGWFTEAEMEDVVDLVCRAAAVQCVSAGDTIRMTAGSGTAP